MMRRLLCMLLVLMLCGPAAVAESPVFYIAGRNADRVHLRAEPSIEADSMGLYYTGTDVIIIGYEADWAWVMIGDEVGYMLREYLTLEDTARLGPWCVVDDPYSTWVNLRMTPSMDGFIVMCPDNGTAVHILGEAANGWSYVECEGVKGYMVTDFLSPMEAEEAARTTIVGTAPDGDYIHRYAAPNGQLLYFVALEENPYINLDDVNFDGHADIVVFSVLGASNFFTDFFVYDQGSGQYVRAQTDSGEELLCNYQLYPEYGLVLSQSNNGNAGLLHVINLYRWEGTNLKLLRRAVSDEWSESSFEGSTYTQIINGDHLHITVRDYTDGYDSAVIFDQVLTKEDAEYRDIFTEEQDALWQGIK